MKGIFKMLNNTDTYSQDDLDFSYSVIEVEDELQRLKYQAEELNAKERELKKREEQLRREELYKQGAKDAYEIAKEYKAKAEKKLQEAEKELDRVYKLQHEHKKTLSQHIDKSASRANQLANENQQLKEKMERLENRNRELIAKIKKLELVNQTTKSPLTESESQQYQAIILRLEQKNKTLEKSLYEEKRKNEALLKSDRIRGRTTIKQKKTQERLRRAAIEATYAIQEAKETITQRARAAGRAKQSPYEAAGTIKAVNELLEEHVELLEQRGGKAQLNRMILDLIAENVIPAPSTPTQKTVDNWIKVFTKQKSAS